MAVQYILVLIAVCSAQNEPSCSQTVPATTIPAQIIPAGRDGLCPDHELLADAKQATTAKIQAYFLGHSAEFPASSCSAVLANSPSGYYWILPATGPPAVQVYCDFNRQCGCDESSTWTRVAFLNMSDPTHTCPNGWPFYQQSQWGLPTSACGGGHPDTCRSATFSNHGHTYNRVCGRITGYQWKRTRAFYSLITSSLSIEDRYLDGISLTHGSVGSRQHIWSFASAAGEVGVSNTGCDCSNNDNWPYNTYFVGSDYFCDSGWEGAQHPDTGYADDLLWDGAGCGPTSSCCQFNDPPWFCKTLPQPTTNDLEVRTCSSTREADIAVSLMELYVQ